MLQWHISISWNFFHRTHSFPPVLAYIDCQNCEQLDLLVWPGPGNSVQTAYTDFDVIAPSWGRSDGLHYFRKSCCLSDIMLNYSENPRGGTQIWKWRTSAYRRTKIGGIQCKISSKKGGHSVWTPKKWGLFWCGLLKMGVIQCAKMQFQGKICKFSVKIAMKSLNFSKCARSAQKFAILM